MPDAGRANPIDGSAPLIGGCQPTDGSRAVIAGAAETSDAGELLGLGNIGGFDGPEYSLNPSEDDRFE